LRHRFVQYSNGQEGAALLQGLLVFFRLGIRDTESGQRSHQTSKGAADAGAAEREGDRADGQQRSNTWYRQRYQPGDTADDSPGRHAGNGRMAGGCLFDADFPAAALTLLEQGDVIPRKTVGQQRLVCSLGSLPLRKDAGDGPHSHIGHGPSRPQTGVLAAHVVVHIVPSSRDRLR